VARLDLGTLSIYGTNVNLTLCLEIRMKFKFLSEIQLR